MRPRSFGRAIDTVEPLLPNSIFKAQECIHPHFGELLPHKHTFDIPMMPCPGTDHGERACASKTHQSGKLEYSMRIWELEITVYGSPRASQLDGTLACM